MYKVFLILLVFAYLFFFIDWKELGTVLRQGGWCAMAVYALTGFFIYIAVTAPEIAHSTGMHHH